jgi:hypothetical protein
MLKFERRLEKIHIAASIEITNPLLKRPFEILTKIDKSHIAIPEQAARIAPERRLDIERRLGPGLAF